jgi:hypothetical protein
MASKSERLILTRRPVRTAGNVAASIQLRTVCWFSLRIDRDLSHGHELVVRGHGSTLLCARRGHRVLERLAVAGVVARPGCAERVAAVLGGVRRTADRVADRALVVLGGARLDASARRLLGRSHPNSCSGETTACYAQCARHLSVRLSRETRTHRASSARSRWLSPSSWSWWSPSEPAP